MDGRDLTVDGAGECAGGTWPATAGVRQGQAAGNASEFMTHDTGPRMRADAAHDRTRRTYADRCLLCKSITLGWGAGSLGCVSSRPPLRTLISSVPIAAGRPGTAIS